MIRTTLNFGPLTIWERLRFAWAVLRGYAIQIQGEGTVTVDEPAQMPSTAGPMLN